MTTKNNGGDVSDKLDEAKEAFSDAAQKVKETADVFKDKVVHDVKEHGQKIQSQLLKYAQDKPIATLGAAMAIGFVLSWLLVR